MFERRIGTIHTYVYHILRDFSSWDVKVKPLFRGEPNDIEDPLLPSITTQSRDENNGTYSERLVYPLIVSNFHEFE